MASQEQSSEAVASVARVAAATLAVDRRPLRRGTAAPGVGPARRAALELPVDADGGLRSVPLWGEWRGKATPNLPAALLGARVRPSAQRRPPAFALAFSFCRTAPSRSLASCFR